ncbi:helix-turn-helix transcriptional regulator [Clostridium massiliamazoniense]|uniref:helix-turn-helix transcriptional regulator n=1 Tax=Clostridium massiliamazoniense TaxID=1347366 RepID=UPI0006D85DFC|nr:helix-turn-helix transcriptional regulator [Clostridium massiliamazoniense]
MNNEFKNRLEKYREECNLNKKEMAKKLGISRSLYSMLINGSRTPSDQVIENLVKISGNNEAYWTFGIDISMDEYLKERESFKTLKEISLSLFKNGIITKENPLTDYTQEIFLKALEADLICFLNKISNKES